MQYQSRIPVSSAFFICSVALVFDIAEMLFLLVYILPLVGIAIGWLFDTILSIVAGFTLWFMFKIKGVAFAGNLKKMMASLGMFFFELTPLGILPLWTLSALWTIRIEWAQEKKEFAAQRAELEVERLRIMQNEAAIAQNNTALQEQARTQAALETAYQNEALQAEEALATKRQAESFSGRVHTDDVEDDGRISGVMPPLHINRPAGRRLR